MRDGCHPLKSKLTVLSKPSFHLMISIGSFRSEHFAVLTALRKLWSSCVSQHYSALESAEDKDSVLVEDYYQRGIKSMTPKDYDCFLIDQIRYLSSM